MLNHRETESEKNKFRESLQRNHQRASENPEREGLIKTPERVTKSMKFLMNGYDSDPDAIMNQAYFMKNILKWFW